MVFWYFLQTQGVASPLIITNSVLLDRNNDEFLFRTPSVAGNQKTFTVSTWMKRGQLSSDPGDFDLRHPVFGGNNGGSTYFRLEFFDNNPDTNEIVIYQWNGGSYDFRIHTTALFRDTTAWMHVVLSVDTTQAEETNRIRLYINGVRVTEFDVITPIGQDQVIYWNNTNLHGFGKDATGGAAQFDGYLAEVNGVDGQALPPSSFGMFDTNGEWQAIEYAGSFGTNGFHLDFTNNTSANGFGLDSSGNSNHWQTSNLSNVSEVEAVIDYLAVSGLQRSSPQSWDENTLIVSGATSAANTARLARYDESGGVWTQTWLTSSYGSTNAALTILTPGRGVIVTTIYNNWATPTHGITFDTSIIAQHTGPNIGFTNYTRKPFRLSDQLSYATTGSPSNSGSDIEFILRYTGTSNVTKGANAANGRWFGAIIPYTEGGETGRFVTVGGSSTLNTNNQITQVRLYSYSGTALTRLHEIIPWSPGVNTTTPMGFLMDDGRFIVYSFQVQEWKIISVSGSSLVVDQTFTYTMSSRWARVNAGYNYGTYNVNGEVLGNDSWIIPFNNYVIDGSTKSSGYIKVTFTLGTLSFVEEIIQESIYDTTLATNLTASGYVSSNSDLSYYTRTNNSSQTRIERDLGNTNSDNQTIDVPRDNFAVLNNLNPTVDILLSKGNLKYNSSFGAATHMVSTLRMTSGKYYFEFKDNFLSSSGHISIHNELFDDNNAGNIPGSTANGWTIVKDSNLFGEKYVIFSNGSSTLNVFGIDTDANDWITIAFDADSKKLWFGVIDDSTGNHLWVDSSGGLTGNPSTNTNPTFTSSASLVGLPISGNEFSVSIFGLTGSVTTGEINFGATPFVDTIPTGFTTLSTDNLTQTIQDSQNYFDTILYTGSDTTQKIIGLNFQADLLWFKNRDVAISHTLYNSVVGQSKTLQSNLDAGEGGNNGLISFDDNGFSIVSTNPALNSAGDNFVAWCWKKGAVPGFDVVQFTKTTAAQNVAHSLSKIPAMFMIKRTDATGDWHVAHQGFADGPATWSSHLTLNSTDVVDVDANWFNSVPTTTLFATGTNIPLGDYVAYLWSEIEGFSKFGSYIGNGNVDGPFVYCGFRPAFVMIKRTNGAEHWVITDSTRGRINTISALLFPSLGNVESNPNPNVSHDFVANGFKIRNNGSAIDNGNGDAYIFMAFAESPLKTSLARGITAPKLETLITQSLIFSIDNQTGLTRSPTSEGSRTTWTWSAWIKRGKFTGANEKIFSAHVNGNNLIEIFFEAGDRLDFAAGVVSANQGRKLTRRVFRDPSAWYHIVCVYDSSNATASDRMRIYVNGVRETVFAFGFDVDPPISLAPPMNGNGVDHGLGRFASSGTQWFDGYMAEVNHVDGQALSAESFGFFDTNGKWQPADYLGTHGTNGFYLTFSDNSSVGALGTDSSGNGNDWTPVVNSVAISQGTGTLIGDMTENGGLAAAFDGTTSQTQGSCAAITFPSGLRGFVGKDFGAGNEKIISQATVYGASDTGYGSAPPNRSFTVYIMVNNTAPVDKDDGTVIGSVSDVENETTQPKTIISNDVTTAYRYVWIRLAVAIGGGAKLLLAEVEFEEVAAIPGFTTTNQVVDTPTSNSSNYCVLNSVYGTQGSITNGNLSLTDGFGSNSSRFGTLAMSSGQWYWETKHTTVTTTDPLIGITLTNDLINKFPGETLASYALYTLGSNSFFQGVTGGVFTNTTAAMTIGNHTLQVAYDADNLKVWFGVDNTWVNGGNPVTGLNPTFTTAPGEYFPSFRGSGSGVSATIDINFGQKTFTFTPPTGFVSVNTSNLPEPAITNPNEFFNTILYTGTGGAGNAITDVNFQPDFTWIKARTAFTVHMLFDSIRGVNKSMSSNSRDDETISSNELGSFDPTGFTVDGGGSTNDTEDYVAWNWKAGTSVSGTTQGSGTLKSYTGSVSTTAGFAIITYEGNQTGGHQIPHHLGAIPDLIIVKNRDLDNRSWIIYHSSNTSAPETDFFRLESTNATADLNTVWNDTAPTSSVFTVGTGGETNENALNMLAYVWTSVEGFSKFGSYTGNGSTDGTFVYCGFKPAWTLIKPVSSGGWTIHDNKRNFPTSQLNPINTTSSPHTIATDGSSVNFEIDYVSNGFKLRGTAPDLNANGTTYIFAAFAEEPFKTSLAR